MKKLKTFVLGILLVLSVLISGCSNQQITSSETSMDNIGQSITSDTRNDADEATSDKSIESESQTTESVISLSDIPIYTDKAYISINGNVPFFGEDDFSTTSFEKYSDLDSLGRCGVAFANIGQDLMPTENRGDIGSITPSGWINKNYGDLVDGGYLYNRCHLIGFQLTAENANAKNLITGTRYLNIEGMLPFENMVADYVQETGNHVLYRVTPIYEGDNLVASGVLMEGYSVEDNGTDIQFCIYAYNVQPGIAIDYATGESYVEDESSDQATSQTTQSPDSSLKVADYILNTNTHKFHYPECSSVDTMNESNKEYFTGSRDELISQGYDPCGRCHP